ncbi:cytochrome b561 [Rhizomicrobium palustre]|uniref:Cytochrome b561 n=1 Tax=Rhizomicrobium palustre TaxID=189966 RepID=A0A846N253_9PROT|nr:cytochrome b [Rhizomicrobium palustre]NIK90064.1 cytochrome b561 [Rhizomicrobium palustre]
MSLTPVSPQRYGTVAMSLHWLIALAIIANLAIVFLIEDMPRPDRMFWMGWHKSIGLTVLILSLARVAWRLTHPAPAHPVGISPAQRIAGAALHHLFYLMIIVVPLAGWLMVSTNPRPIPFFGLFDFPAFPGLSGMTREEAHPYHELFENIHVLVGWAFVFLVPVHIAAALYHHHFLKNNVLLRMIPGSKLRP